MNLQDSFLNQVRKENTEIKLILMDGTKLIGLVRGFDNFTVILNSQGANHLIYKHAITQIINRRPTSENEREGRREPPRERKPPRGGQSEEKKTDKRKFNTLDLSTVSLAEAEKNEAEKSVAEKSESEKTQSRENA